jgi:hypothetical protein
MATTLAPPKPAAAQPTPRTNGGNGKPRAGGTPVCPANIRETQIAFGFKPQADLTTPNTEPELWSMTKTNNTLATVTFNTEDDSQDIGKGDEFPTQQFPTSIDTAVPVEKFASSEFLAHEFCFLTGKATKTAAGTGFQYSAVPSDPVANCINLPAFTYLEQIRSQPDSIVDRALIGCVINDFTLTMQSGPGRANCTASANWVGTGRYASPSGLTVPALTLEHFLNAASAQITINGIDYILSDSFVSLEFKYNNNVRLPGGFFPGSGTDANGYAVRGRMQYNNREISLTFVALAQKGSPEFNNLVSQHEGPLSVGLTGPIIGAGPDTHGMLISAPRTVISAVSDGDADGLVTVNCTVKFLKPTVGSIITMSATCEQDGILGL